MLLICSPHANQFDCWFVCARRSGRTKFDGGTSQPIPFKAQAADNLKNIY
jgi:hypothetical protein